MDDLQRQLDRALQPDAVAMPREYERQAASLVVHRAQPAPAEPVVLRMQPRKTMAWMQRLDVVAIAACLLLAGGVGLAVWYSMRNPPPSPNPYVLVPDIPKESPFAKLPSESIGAMLRHFREKQDALATGIVPDAVALNVTGSDEEVARIFDAPRRGIPLSDSARQLGLE